MTQSLFMGMAGAVLVPSSIPSDDGVLTICSVPSWHMGPAWTFHIPSQYVFCFFCLLWLHDGVRVLLCAHPWDRVAGRVLEAPRCEDYKVVTRGLGWVMEWRHLNTCTGSLSAGASWLKRQGKLNSIGFGEHRKQSQCFGLGLRSLSACC